MEIRKLPPLKEGDKIGVLAPAGPVRRRYIERGWGLLLDVGWQPVASHHLFSDAGMVSAPPQERLQDLYQFLQDESIRGIWAARGGYGTIQLLDDMSVDLFRQNPKCLVGFSDVTTLNWALFATAHLPTFSGFTLTLQFLPDNPYVNLGVEILTGKRNRIGQEDLEDPLRIVRDGSAEGIFLGGTLSIIVSLLGTPFFPDLQNKPIILFIEDVDEPLYRIDRYLHQLFLAGVFKQVTGLILGKFLHRNQTLDVVPLIRHLVPATTVIVDGFPYGHFTKSLLLPVGVWARLQTNPFQLTWESPFLLQSGENA